MATVGMLNTSAQSIDRVLQAGLPVMLLFWRPAAPVDDEVLETLARSYAGRAIVARVNVDEEAALAQRFRVSATPLFLLMRNGKAEIALASEEARRNVAGWLAHFVDGQPQPVVTRRPPAPGAGESKPLVLTDASFDAALDQPLPVLVDFWASWCGPCRMVAPSVEKLAQEFAGRALVGKLNVDENQATARRYQVMSIPTLIIFEHGQPVEQIVGAQPYPALQQRLSRFI